MLPVHEIAGDSETVLYHVARQALGGRVFRGMRRARLALRLREVEGEEGQAIAARLGLHPSGATRDLKAARIEREYPTLAAILARPSEAPVSYYNDLRDHADRQVAPDKAMAAIVTQAARLLKTGRRFTPTRAKAALGLPERAGGPAITLGDVGAAHNVTCERTADGRLRVALTLDAPDVVDTADMVRRWIAAAGTAGEAGS